MFCSHSNPPSENPLTPGANLAKNCRQPPIRTDPIVATASPAKLYQVDLSLNSKSLSKFAGAFETGSDWYIEVWLVEREVCCRYEASVLISCETIFDSNVRFLQFLSDFLPGQSLCLSQVWWQILNLHQLANIRRQPVWLLKSLKGKVLKSTQILSD